jgi:hypothetical protein
LLIQDALRGKHSICQPGRKYWQAGVKLNELIDNATAREQMFPRRDPYPPEKYNATRHH